VRLRRGVPPARKERAQATMRRLTATSSCLKSERRRTGAAAERPYRRGARRRPGPLLCALPSACSRCGVTSERGLARAALLARFRASCAHRLHRLHWAARPATPAACARPRCARCDAMTTVDEVAESALLQAAAVCSGFAQANARSAHQRCARSWRARARCAACARGFVPTSPSRSRRSRRVPAAPFAPRFVRLPRSHAMARRPRRLTL
jgi:hypothetical protein